MEGIISYLTQFTNSQPPPCQGPVDFQPRDPLESGHFGAKEAEDNPVLSKKNTKISSDELRLEKWLPWLSDHHILAGKYHCNFPAQLRYG